MKSIGWKTIILGTMVGVSMLTSSAVAQVTTPTDNPVVQMDKRGSGALNSGREGDRQVDRRDNLRSNAGGELRGLDRADQVAGDHGREGRENARMRQMEQPNRPERMDQLQRPERPERAGRH